MSDTIYPSNVELKCGPVRAIDLALFAAASGDHNPLHLDEDVARGAGFERPVIHGMYTMACVGRLFTQQFSTSAMRSIVIRFTGTALRGEVLEISATLESQSNGCATYGVTVRSSGGNNVASATCCIQAVPA